jgi:hypothetical protein
VAPDTFAVTDGPHLPQAIERVRREGPIIDWNLLGHLAWCCGHDARDERVQLRAHNRTIAFASRNIVPLDRKLRVVDRLDGDPLFV